jgi:hypothetical protein
MRISRKYYADDWKRLDLTSELDWKMAIAIFQDRLETRYLEHIRALLLRKTSGFAVLALDCALIETLQQFRLGTPKTPFKKGEKYFISFLTETPFAEHFDKKLASLFYTTIRCGLLHQTEAEGTSRINRGKDRPLIAYTTDHTGVAVNTHRFHELLEQTIRDYVAVLLTPASVEARLAFQRKMNFICRIEGMDSENRSLLA